MARAEELRQSIRLARASFIGALAAVQDGWESRPSGSVDGEAAWSPREVADHVAGADWYFTNVVAVAAGGPEVARPLVDLRSPAAAAQAIEGHGRKFAAVVDAIADADLVLPLGSEFGDGTATVETALVNWSGHIALHTEQLRAAASLA